MKEDDAKVDHPHQMLLYVEKADGSYGTVQTGSYMAHNYLDDFQEKQQYFHETNLKAVLSGEASPIAYYLHIQELSIPECADRIGLSKAAVKRHMQPKYFEHITIKQAIAYAELFGIPVARLFAFINVQNPTVAIKFQASASPAVCQINILPRNP